MEEQGSFFQPDDYKNAWTKEEGNARLAPVRAAYLRASERYNRGHEAQNRIAGQFNDRRAGVTRSPSAFTRSTAI